VTFLPQLKDQLVASSPRARRRRSARVVAAIVAVGLLIAAGALAATGVIDIGSKVEPPARLKGNPEVGSGVALGRSARLLPLRVADPAGGPPWGLQLVRTSRGLTCLQVGRVVDGKLGVLGQDGIAHDDGRFHELSPRFARLQPGCAAPDAQGSSFIAIDWHGGLASGEGPRRSCLAPGEGAPGRKRCPVADHRRFLYGLLGSDVSGLAYRDRGRTRSARVAGPEGAYLIVLAGRQAGGGTTVGTAPFIGHPFTRITYRDGSVCPAPGATQRERRCEPGGYRSLLAGLDRDSLRRPLRLKQAGRRLVISFKAPVAVQDARLSYWANAHFASTCPQIYFVPSTNRDVRRGSVVQLEIKLPRRCHGPLRGVVTLSASATGMPTPPAGGDPHSSIVIGRFRERIPLPGG
jgi:hypothetical protein